MNWMSLPELALIHERVIKEMGVPFSGRFLIFSKRARAPFKYST